MKNTYLQDTCPMLKRIEENFENKGISKTHISMCLQTAWAHSAAPNFSYLQLPRPYGPFNKYVTVEGEGRGSRDP